MPENTRRAFIAQVGAGVSSLGMAPMLASPAPEIDFRYAPLDGQTAICFPDDLHKSLVGGSGDLRYGHPGTNTGIDAFSSIVRFSVAGMEADRLVRQELEAPTVPILHTWLERTNLQLELVAFATDRPDEGRVDNVIVYIRNRTGKEFRVAPLVHVDTRAHMQSAAAAEGHACITRDASECFLMADHRLAVFPAFAGWTLAAPALRCIPETPVRLLFRFPLQGQPAARLQEGLDAPDALLAWARQYWNDWQPFGGQVRWKLPGRYQEFLSACARNILQAREVKDGRKTFQVGPTCYRGLWIVDGNFILEAARYLGYDTEAQQGLEATWTHQQPDGGVFAAVPGEHWKDTAIAMFTMVRQAELGGDWSYFNTMAPALLRASEFLKRVRGRGLTENSANGRYHILARGFGDGGLGGVRSEFTNTVWALAGLQAVAGAATRQGLDRQFTPVRQFHDELRAAFLEAAPREMRRHPAGFDYLPMLMKEDRAWDVPDVWSRPRPQVAQWALSHAIYPGLVFDKNDAVVRGHIALMRACTREDVPTETGWMPHDSLWTYNAAFAAHVYLWAGVTDWATRTFHGFLNHASPQYCWREEQPVRNGLVSGYWGDMPHNWASAECILYLRHMLALEDGPRLRLLAGWPALKEEVILEQTPTRFGRINLRLTPRAGGWRCEFARSTGPAPAQIELPALMGNARLEAIEGARFDRMQGTVRVDPTAVSFAAEWKG